MKNYSAIDIFNDWAKSGRDKGMEEGHNDSGSQIVQIVKDLKNNDFEQYLSILDIGCGNGWLLRKITANYKNSSGLGIDGSLNMINNASTIDKMNQYTVADLNYWTPENKFDIVISMEVLYYLDNPQQFLRKIKKIYLNDGGVFVFGIDHYLENKSSLTWPEDLNVKMHTLSMRKWIHIVEKAGFSFSSSENLILAYSFSISRYANGYRRGSTEKSFKTF